MSNTTQIIEHKAQEVAVQSVTPMQLLANAIEKGVDPDQLSKLMDLQERYEDRNAEKAFNSAMTKCQAEIGTVVADKNNNQTRSLYASYAALNKVVRPVYSKHGFSLSFDTGDAQALEVMVKCYVSHSDGHTRTYQVLMPADGKGAKGGDVMTKTHAAGSAMSYGQRYLLKLIFNVAVGDHDDDDGNAASVTYINDKQIITITDFIENEDIDKAKFLKHYNITDVSEIPEEHFQSVLSALKAKAAKQ